MRTSRPQLETVLTAARRLMDAHEASAITVEDWDALLGAIHACGLPDAPARDETFTIDHYGSLIRRVVPTRGEPYEHRCPSAAYYAAAQTVAALATGVTVEGVRAGANITWTQAAVALAFFKERGILNPAGGRTHAIAGTAPFEDAMTEYHALREVPR